MLSDEYLSMLSIGTQEELFAKVEGFVRRLGMPLMTAMPASATFWPPSSKLNTDRPGRHSVRMGLAKPPHACA